MLGRWVLGFLDMTLTLSRADSRPSTVVFRLSGLGSRSDLSCVLVFKLTWLYVGVAVAALLSAPLSAFPLLPLRYFLVMKKTAIAARTRTVKLPTDPPMMAGMFRLWLLRLSVIGSACNGGGAEVEVVSWGVDVCCVAGGHLRSMVTVTKGRAG